MQVERCMKKRILDEKLIKQEITHADYMIGILRNSCKNFGDEEENMIRNMDYRYLKLIAEKMTEARESLPDELKKKAHPYLIAKYAYARLVKVGFSMEFLLAQSYVGFGTVD